MTKLAYGTSAYSRSRGRLPGFELVNLFIESSLTNQRQIVLLSRKGLGEVGEYGSGPVRASLKKDGVFGGDRFTVSGNQVYRESTLLGTITGDGPVSIAASDTEVIFTAGASIYSYNGTNFVEVTFPDDANVIKVLYTSNYFIALREGSAVAQTSGLWYFSAVNNGRSWDALDFATAETEPDSLLDACVIDDVLVFLGTETVEFWAPTGNEDLPYAPIQQRVFERGVVATGCVVAEDNSFFWVGDDKIIYRNGDVPEAIADDAIVEASIASATHRLYLLTDERHKFICLRLDTKTFAYDITTRQWCEFKSYGRTNFRCGPDYGDDETGVVWEFSSYSDGEDVIERLFTSGAELEQPVIIRNLRLQTEVGGTQFLTGEYTEPTIEMRYSADAGQTWSDWEPESLGAQGEYRKRVEWRALGMFDDPGMLFQFRVTDPVSVRLSDVSVNTGFGGRSR